MQGLISVKAIVNGQSSAGLRYMLVVFWPLGINNLCLVGDVMWIACQTNVVIQCDRPKYSFVGLEHLS